MPDTLTTKTLSIRECGYDEIWLRDRIFETPAILGLGDLQSLVKERSQPKGGRLDMLLKDIDDESMYEVELQLGATDESHIIRTIEYWDREKRRWPDRSHTAVLVAEQINSRFYNVVHHLSMAIPIIGIQANIIEMKDLKGLHFTKIIDSFETAEAEEPSQRGYDEKHWVDNYSKTLECIRWYKALLEKFYADVTIRYFETYVSLVVGGIARLWVNIRQNDRAFIEIKYVESNFEEAEKFLNAKGVQFKARRNKTLAFNVNLHQLREHAAEHEWLAERIAPQNLSKGGK